MDFDKASIAICKEGRAIYEMQPIQKRHYYLLLFGSIFSSMIPIKSILLFITLFVHTIVKDPEAIGYVGLFLAFPTFIVTSLSTTMVVILFVTLKPSVYKRKKGPRIVHVVIGCISIILSPVYMYFINFLMKTTFLATNTFTDFVPLLDADTFHPVKLIYAIYFVGPLLLLFGGIWGGLNYPQQPEEIEKNK